MELDRTRSVQLGSPISTTDQPAAVPERLQRRGAPSGAPPAATTSEPVQLASSAFTVQLFADAVNAGVNPTEQVQRAAAHGLSGASGSLPHLAAIQHAFGRHDVSSVQAHLGGRAAEAAAAMGAHGYAAGNAVAFATSPDLHLAAHEAAHVVQQRGGVHLKGGVGEVGDTYERHADAVADLVVQGHSAESLLDAMAPAMSNPGGGVQRVAIQLDLTGAAGGGRAQAEHDIDALTTLDAAQGQLTAIHTASSGAGTSVMAMVELYLHHSRRRVQVAASDLPALAARAEALIATLQVARTGTTLSGLVGHMPEDQRIELEALVHRYAYGSTGGIAEIDRDGHRIAELARGITGPVDPLSAASLFQAATMMQASLESAERAAGPTIGPDPGDGISLEEHDAAGVQSAGALSAMGHGPFAALFYIITLAQTGDHAEAERHAIAGSFVDSLLSNANAARERQESMTPRQEPEPTAPRAQPLEPPPPDEPPPDPQAPLRPRTGPAPESRRAQRMRERRQQEGHSRVMAPRRGTR